MHLLWYGLNVPYAARPNYLLATATHAMTTPGPILECGSGITTIVLSYYAMRRGVEVWTLEHHPGWHKRNVDLLRRFNSELTPILAPLREFDGFLWYDVPEQLPSDFRLVICDGPPGDTPGGRYGLAPVLGDHISDEAVILLDDIRRPGEQEALLRWGEEFGWRWDEIDEARRPYAIVRKF